jgi:hypothetical protein
MTEWTRGEILDYLSDTESWFEVEGHSAGEDWAKVLKKYKVGAAPTGGSSADIIRWLGRRDSAILAYQKLVLGKRQKLVSAFERFEKALEKALPGYFDVTLSWEGATETADQPPLRLPGPSGMESGDQIHVFLTLRDEDADLPEAKVKAGVRKAIKSSGLGRSMEVSWNGAWPTFKERSPL